MRLNGLYHKEKICNFNLHYGENNGIIFLCEVVGVLLLFRRKGGFFNETTRLL